MRTLLLSMLCGGLLAFTGCKTMNTQGCSDCSMGACSGQMCGDGGCGACRGSGGGGLLAKLGGNSSACDNCGVNGCNGAGQAGSQRRPNPVGHLPKDSRLTRRGREIVSGPAGPPSATYSYPYYTTRGPRDYFDSNPVSIGY